MTAGPYNVGMIVAKVIAVASLLYVAFVVAFCPCQVLLSCHKLSVSARVCDLNISSHSTTGTFGLVLSLHSLP